MDHFPPVTLNSSGKLQHFEIIEQVGEGTYGRVFKAVHRVSRKVVALKRIPIGKKFDGIAFTAIREINNLIQLAKCKNVVDMHDSFLQEEELVIVLEFCEYDLSALLSVPGVDFPLAQAKYFLKQVLEACHQCHSHGLMHRDVKAANVLINREGQLKLADLGLMTTFDRTMQHSSQVVTLWYRAPELLLGEACYGPAIDLWSIGCVMVEIFTKHSPFPGRSEEDQLDLISQVCGTPTEENYTGVEKTPHYQKLLANKTLHQRKLRRIYASRMSEEALDLLEKLLTIDPRRRIKAQEALRHPFFASAPVVPDKPQRITCYESIHEYQVKLKRKALADASSSVGSTSSSSSSTSSHQQASKRQRPIEKSEPSPPSGQSSRPSAAAKDSRPPSGGPNGISPTVPIRHSASSAQQNPSSKIRSSGMSPKLLRASDGIAQPPLRSLAPTSSVLPQPMEITSTAATTTLAQPALAPAAVVVQPPVPAPAGALTAVAVPSFHIFPPVDPTTSTLSLAVPSAMHPPVGSLNPYLQPAKKQSQIAH